MKLIDLLNVTSSYISICVYFDEEYLESGSPDTLINLFNDDALNSTVIDILGATDNGIDVAIKF